MRRLRVAAFVLVVLAVLAVDISTGQVAFAQDALPKIIAGLDSTNKNVRFQAIIALGNHGTGARSAAAPLKDLVDREREPQVALQAVQALTQIGAHAELRELLGHPGQHIRWQAVAGLGVIGPPAKKAVPDLIRLLADEQPITRMLAAQALGEIGLESELDARKVIFMLRDVDPDVRQFALYALMNVGPNSIPALEKMLSDTEPVYVRTACLQALANQGPPAKAVLPTVIKLLSDPEAEIRAQSAATAAAIGADAKDALPALFENLLDKDAQVQMYSFQAAMIVGQADRKALLDALKAANAKGRWNAPVLGNGLTGKQAVAALLKDLSAKDADNRAMAALALGRLGKDAEPAIPALVRLAKEDAKQVRNAAQQALAQLDRNEREAYYRKLQAEQARWLRDAKADWSKFATANAAEAVKLKNLPAQLQIQMAKVRTERLSVVTKNAPQQAYLRQLVQMHIALSSMTASARDQDPPPEADWVRERLSLMGPEAIPAFVDGYNYGINYDVGFV